MYRKYYLSLLSIALFLSVATMTAFAQTAPIRGEVKLKKADGTVVPVAGAVVEAFRADIDKGKMPDTKTDKKGEFSWVGAPLGQRFVLAVSGPGINPMVEPGIRAGMENIVLTVSEGDGRRLTEVEAREAAKSTTTVAATPAEMTEEQKKAKAEYDKKVAEVAQANKKAEDSNKIVNASLKAGDAAFKAQNYDVAITEFGKGVDAEPDFVGSAPVLLNYQGVAYQKRALATYNASVKGDAAAKIAAADKIKSDFANAMTAFNRGLEVIAKAGSTDPTEQKNATANKINLLGNALDTHGYAARLAPDDARDALAGAVLEQYVAAEPDATKRAANILIYANNMNGAGQLKQAAIAYRKVLEVQPDNLDAIAGLGLALYTEGSMSAPPDKTVLQEGLNYMQKFVDTAPETHTLKESIRATIEDLKNTQKLTPQKTTPPKRKG